MGLLEYDVAISFSYNLIDTDSGQLLESVGIPPGALDDEFMLPAVPEIFLLGTSTNT